MLVPNAVLIALQKKKLDRATLAGLLNDPLRLRMFAAYDPAKVAYTDEQGRTVATGLPALEAYLAQNPGKRVFLGRRRQLFDLALEGGGAFGFCHMGTAHAMALRGIWFDRIAGTSAGSIAAALIAGGYQIDLNYKTITDMPIANRLQPSPANSLNQLLFDDLFQNFTDYERNLGAVRAMITGNDTGIHNLVAAVVGKAVREHFTVSAILNKIDASVRAIRSTYFAITTGILDGVLDFRLPVLGKVGDIGLGPVTLRNTASVVQSLTDIIASPIRAAVDALVADINSRTGPVIDAIDDAIKAVTQQLADAIADAILLTLVTTTGIDIQRSAADIILQSRPGLNEGIYALWRLIELGGLWDGNVIRDWVEEHLQQLNTGTGPVLDGTGDKPRIPARGTPARAILFRDLPIELCIVAADMGPAKGGDGSEPAPVFFSRRTTPDYPVAEAVRRSISLPFVFIPRQYNDGYGGESTAPAGTPPQGIGTAIGNVGAVRPNLAGTRLSAISLAIRSARTRNHVLQDGGIFFNMPAAVFRDPESTVFDEKTDRKPLIISNINARRVASERPHDIPLSQKPEPLHSILGGPSITGGNPMAMLMNGTLPDNPPQPFSKGLIKLSKSMKFLSGYALSIHQDEELNSLMALVPNSFFVDVPLRDPGAGAGSALEFLSTGGRIDSGSFAMPKTTKKWIVQNAFEATKQAFLDYEGEVPAMARKLALPAAMNPYRHFLNVSNARLSNGGPVQLIPRAKFGDACYSTPRSQIVPLFRNGGALPVANQLPLGFEFPLTDAAGNPVKVASGGAVMDYLGSGCTWIRLGNNAANQSDTGAALLSFDVDVRCRLFVAIDGGTPAFATTTNGWQTERETLTIARPDAAEHPVYGRVTAARQTTTLAVFSKIFEPGSVVIPGPRNVTQLPNTVAYLVLARPV